VRDLLKYLYSVYLKAKHVPSGNGRTLLQLPINNILLLSNRIDSSSWRISRIHDPVANPYASSRTTQSAERREAGGDTHLSPAE
jgi:hypothetical protein